MHRLRFGTSDVKLIDPTHRPGPGPIGIDQQLGLRYLTFVVTNLDEVIQRLEAEHIAFTRPKTTIRPGTTIAMVKDPDGNIVEFVERG
jgi:predicted enzyme related to lactoylglutathione lyase